MPLADHPLRYPMANELHARPFPVLRAPAFAAFLAIKAPEDAAGRDRAADLAHLTALVESLGLPEFDAASLAPALLKHTGGNAMFALETLKDMVLSGVPAAANRLPQPATVGALIERRLTQLSPAALKLAGL